MHYFKRTPPLLYSSLRFFFFIFYVCLTIIKPQDHHFEHRLDQAVTMVVSILSGKFCGSSYECFTDLSVYLLELGLANIILSTVSTRATQISAQRLQQNSVGRVMIVLLFE